MLIKHLRDENRVPYATLVVLEPGIAGLSICHPKDHFNKKEGVRVARERAERLKDLRNYLDRDSRFGDIYKDQILKDDFVLTLKPYMFDHSKVVDSDIISYHVTKMSERLSKPPKPKAPQTHTFEQIKRIEGCFRPKNNDSPHFCLYSGGGGDLGHIIYVSLCDEGVVNAMMPARTHLWDCYTYVKLDKKLKLQG